MAKERFALTEKGRAYLACRRLGLLQSDADIVRFNAHWASIQQKKETAHHEKDHRTDCSIAAAE